MPRLRPIRITDSNAYAVVKNGDDLLFHKVKPKITNIHWWIQRISWTDRVAKTIWLEKDGVPELNAIGIYKYIALIERWGRWKEKVRYAVLYTPIEIIADEYDGTNIYWCPLSGEARSRFNDEEFKKTCDEMEGVPYNYWGKTLKRIFKNSEIISKVISSSFTAYCDRRSMKVIIKNVSKMTPQDQAERGIHDSNYYQILGEHLLIPDFNSKTAFYNE